MKNSIPISILACALCVVPATAFADPHDQGNHPQSSRSSAPAHQQQTRSSRQQTTTYRQTTTTYRQPASNYRQTTTNYQQQSAGNHQSRSTLQIQPRPVQPMPRYQGRQVQNVYAYHSRNDRVAWDWNRGSVWYARPEYWGGGFWGSFALGLSFNNYNVQPSSPGAQLLENYGLTQTTCDQPNLVDIQGPNGSEICAYPNNTVSPGEYTVDYSTLTLESTDQQ